MEKILLLGRKGFVVNETEKALNIPDVQIFVGTSIDDVRSTLERTDH